MLPVKVACYPHDPRDGLRRLHRDRAGERPSPRGPRGRSWMHHTGLMANKGTQSWSSGSDPTPGPATWPGSRARCTSRSRMVSIFIALNTRSAVRSSRTDLGPRASGPTLHHECWLLLGSFTTPLARTASWQGPIESIERLGILHSPGDDHGRIGAHQSLVMGHALNTSIVADATRCSVIAWAISRRSKGSLWWNGR